MHGPFEGEHWDIIAIGLWSKFEIGMDIDATNAKGVGRKGLHGRIDHIIPKSDMHLARAGSGDTVASSDHVSAWY